VLLAVWTHDTQHHERPGVEGLLVLIRTEPSRPKRDHGLPIVVDEAEEYAIDHVGHRDVGEQPLPREILDGKDAEGVPPLLRDKFSIEGDINGNKDCAAKDGNGEEDPSHHTEETEKCDCIETELVEEDGLLDMDEGGDP